MMEKEIEKEIRKLFDRIGWHHYSKAQRIYGKKKCHWCKGKNTKRALVNVWGTVCDIDACDECHKKYHGTCRDNV